MKINKKYWAFLPGILIFAYLWLTLAFMKIRCICLWNQYGFLAVTISVLVILGAHLFFVHYLIKKDSKKFWLKYAICLILSVLAFILILRVVMIPLIECRLTEISCQSICEHTGYQNGTCIDSAELGIENEIAGKCIDLSNPVCQCQKS